MRTIIGVCLDESSSMSEGGKQAAAVSAFNEYLKTQQTSQADECLMSVVKFNTKAWVLDKMQPVADIKPLDGLRYAPMGSTALNDAVIYVTKEIASGMKPEDRALIVILTDGEENSSEASKDDVRKLIDHYTATGDFTFVYLSASLNAFHDGAALGVHASNVGQYTNSAGGVASAMAAFDANAVAYRSSSMKQARGMSAGVGRVAVDVDVVVSPAPAPTVTEKTDRDMWK